MAAASARSLVPSMRRWLLHLQGLWCQVREDGSVGFHRIVCPNGFPMSSLANSWCFDILCKCHLCMFALLMVSVFFLFSVEATNYSIACHLRTRHHPVSQSYKVHCHLLQRHCSARVSYGNSREAACRLLHSKLSFQRLVVDIWITFSIIMSCMWTGIHLA